MSIYEKLAENAKSKMYPFHMPGHKRNIAEAGNPYALDITEIHDFDDLHHAEGILKEAQDKAAAMYGAKRAWYLINGSTCGILAALSAAVPKRTKILTARNCHKAVYHALYLRELTPVYIYPGVLSPGLQGVIAPEQVKKAIEENPDARALVLTSPTYDGVVSDIRSIAELLHEHNMALIVDQAHGAHFGLEPEGDSRFPESAGACGADVVIVSVHKTLPAFTQTALLLQYSDRVAAERLEEFLDIYETSSPSYLLMAGIERGLELVEKKGKELFPRLHRNLARFYREMSGLRQLHVVTREEMRSECWDFDDSKLLIRTGNAAISGGELADRLRFDYHIEPEMTAGTYVLALATLMDTEEGFGRLAEALLEIDEELAEQTGADRKSDLANVPLLSPAELYRPRERRFELFEKDDYSGIRKTPQEAIGRTALDFIYLYPPGIPLVVPGEVIPEELPRQLMLAAQTGIEVCGPDENGRLFIAEESVAG